MHVRELFITSTVCSMLLSASVCAQPSDPLPVRAEIPPASAALVTACMGLTGSHSAKKPLELKVQVDLQGRKFLLNTGQQVVITSAMPSDGGMVVIRDVFMPMNDETPVAFGPALKLYLSHQRHDTFGDIAIALSAPVREGQSYAFTGTGIVGTDSGIPGHVSIYYDAPPNADRAVTVGLATSQDTGEPRPVNHYVLQRFETRVIPIPGPCVLILVGGGVKSGETLPIHLLRPVKRVQAVTGEGPPVRLAPGVPILSNALRVDLTASEQVVVHFDSALNAFQYGPYPD